jgi:predicted acylesterase/phospholipase RssA
VRATERIHRGCYNGRSSRPRTRDNPRGWTLLTWQFDRIEAFTAVVGSTTWNWEHTEVLKHLKDLMAIEPDNIRKSLKTQWRAVVAARLPSQCWPERPLLITAIDAHTGEPVAFDRHSGVDLVDAVAASTSNGFGVPPYSIGDNRYIDGGYDATRMPIWQPDTHGCWCCHPSVADHGIRWSGACTLLHRSTNSARATAESRRSSRTATRSARSVST